MKLASRDTYARLALNQIPRLLGNQDRDPFSPTFGCFHRDYWLDKTSDFPDAVRQFAVHALALVYKHDFPGNIYKGQPKVRDWAIAGLDFWAKIQHKEGSFDEFYPYERGWVGPTGFTTFAAVEAFRLLQDEISADVVERVLAAILRAARFIARGQSEEDHLANHHAMACLAVWKAYGLLGDAELKASFERLWQGLLSYHNAEEGWFREYDGVDPGYLSATVSFLAKIYQTNPDPEIFEVIRQSVEFCSYFVYPNGFYAGSLGSRNTQHFYPHGFEIMAKEIPLAAAVAERMLQALKQDKLVPPEIMSDRYVVYRVPEFLQAYLDYTPRPQPLPPLPYKREPFRRYFPGARIYAAVEEDYYVIANLAKGGVVKVFDRREGRLVLNDCGLIGQLSDASVVTSQWVDPAYECKINEDGWEVEGYLQHVPTHKLFTPIKNLLFRLALVTLGWNPKLSHLLKGYIRKALIMGQRAVPVRFHRRCRVSEQGITITDELHPKGKMRFQTLSIGDEFFVRYVPQSRYFQSQELETHGCALDEAQLTALMEDQPIAMSRMLEEGRWQECDDAVATPSFKDKERMMTTLPSGVYDEDYYTGRQHKRQLIYRLERRTDEVETALQRHADGCLQVIVDLGTADGLMLEKLSQRLGTLTYLGLDLSFELLRVRPIDGIFKCQGNALCLPIKSGVADAVIATSVIEHVPDASVMLQECARILRTGGLLVLTTPEPLMERLASAVGLLKEAGHQRTFKLTELRMLAEANAFEVLEARKFMFSPIGFPGEKRIERIFGPVGLKLIMGNQLLVARRT